MQSLLLWLNLDVTLVLQASGDGAKSGLENFGPDFKDWPDDSNIDTEKRIGLVVWEGKITDSDCDGFEFYGQFRPLTEKEWAALRLGKDIFE